MYDTYMGVIWALGFQFAPENWAYCAGGTLQIAQFTGLFSLIGVNFGGDARVTFKLPDLRSRTPVGFNTTSTPRLTEMGEQFGLPSYHLNWDTMPTHTHSHTYSGTGGNVGVTFTAAAQKGTKKTPDDGDYLAAPASALALTDNLYVPEADVTDKATLGGVLSGGTITPFSNDYFAIATAGTGEAFEFYQPSLAINYCICVDGLYPSRN
ncbi:phage tail protein [Thalassospira marina]|uniref:Phage tail collar domain-containing protein n=1 Tax=Thalassospira marina TaxID=2048283 RepID=A0A2N3KBP6_9PROT|nr:tail fiber protein [Thalassospira marina]AUG54028.1 hypothetical protein CSC3H3_15835 [Thalassospira marina]PKR47977.1 hypothetical protein COO20_25245 [Thalassospira marina]